MIWFSSRQRQIHHGSVAPTQAALCPLSWDPLLGRQGAGRSGPAQWVWYVGMECSSLGRRGQQVGRWASRAAGLRMGAQSPGLSGCVKHASAVGGCSLSPTRWPVRTGQRTPCSPGLCEGTGAQ